METCFVNVYKTLITKIVDKYKYSLCFGCKMENEIHICDSSIANYFFAYGSSLLIYATWEEKHETWRRFWDVVLEENMSKMDIIDWTKNFTYIDSYLDRNREKFAGMM